MTENSLNHPYISDAAAAILPRVLRFLAHDRCGDIWDRCELVERLQWVGLARVPLDDTITIRPWEKLPAHTRQQLAQWLARTGSLFARLAHLSVRAND
jgi:hypothetical protein